VAQGAQDAELPEVAQGLTGAYVRICTVDGKNSDEGDIRGKYHLLQVGYALNTSHVQTSRSYMVLLAVCCAWCLVTNTLRAGPAAGAEHGT
jgi:hypothetical protein